VKIIVVRDCEGGLHAIEFCKPNLLKLLRDLLRLDKKMGGKFMYEDAQEGKQLLEDKEFATLHQLESFLTPFAGHGSGGRFNFASVKDWNSILGNIGGPWGDE